MIDILFHLHCVNEDIPLKEGLKHNVNPGTYITGTVNEDIPLKEGLKRNS